MSLATYPDPHCRNPTPVTLHQVYKLEASRRARAEKSYREGKTHWMVTHTRPLTLILILTLTLTLTLALALAPPLTLTL